ncbi:unnamed protein product [Brassica rapa subsp. narinosa]
MINRDSRGHSYFIVRGEILGFMKDEQLRAGSCLRRCYFEEIRVLKASLRSVYISMG